MDVEDIAPGQRFAQTIAETIAGCSAVLIVIGPRWVEILRQRARDQQRDYVREEIEAALERQVTIVPVLVGGAGAGELNGLPDKLAGLGQYEAAELRDSTFSEDCSRLATGLHLPAAEAGGRKGNRKKIFLLGAAAVLLLAVAAVAIGPWSEHRARQAAMREMFATARSQVERAEYEPAFKTSVDILKTAPGDTAALDLQADAAMRWLEEFHILAPEGTKAEDLAAAKLDQIMPVLDAALARTKGQGQRAADILAHLGWAHWLNQKIAHREYGPAAERDFQQALTLDPSNVFAHAMSGNYLMQTGGDTAEALRHFRTAVAQNKERPLVRAMELGVMTNPDDPEIRAELIRIVNDMRRNGEPLDAARKHRVLSAYDPTVNSGAELQQTLSAVPPSEAWATYLWLDEQKSDNVEYQRVRHDFIYAGILELEGKREDALSAFEKLRGELRQKGMNGRIATHVDNAIGRLSTH
jgi:tetratricopeptide (TPR) repeat protein